jgi:(4-(4-[2-(gamma-L-glutamylamino)ethyl]phenoxymethyl)furan-2-yl)methanamine synthase
MVVMGWDLGGAHLKAARIEAGRVSGAASVACPLWQGLDKLYAAFADVRQQLGEADVHAVTMTGELSDIFASRAEGVEKLCGVTKATLPGKISAYGGSAGWLDVTEASRRADLVGSANWHATATWVAEKYRDALFVDMGSTTTDVIPVADGKVAARGWSDAERLASGELVYTGATRTFLMAVAQRVPFRGAWTPVMNEYFASTADVHRILGELPEDADRLSAADSRPKDFPGSRARLARMIGRDAGEAEEWEWRNLAAFFGDAQLRAVQDAALQVASATRLADGAPVVAAGTGRFIVAKLAARLGRSVEPWEKSVPAEPSLGAIVSDCAPAVAVGLLLSAQGSPP